MWVDKREWSALAAGLLVLACAGLSACSGGSSSGAPPIDDGGQQEPGGTPGGLLDLQDDPATISDVPDVVSSEVLANSGLQVAYTEASQRSVAPPLMIESQWLYMQACLELTGVAPIVVIRTAAVVPFTALDDVIFGIEGIPIASSSRRSVPVVQVLAADFDGTLGSPGFNLRSIIGRLLWSSAGLAERDYPFACAQQQP